MTVIAVLVIDQHPIFCAGLRHLLDAQGGAFALVAQTDTGADGVRLVAAHEPHVVLLSAEVAGLDGLEVIRTMRQHHPGTAVVILRSHHDAETLFYASTYGAAAYLVKTDSAATVLATIRQVAAGQYLINDRVRNKPVGGAPVRNDGPFLAAERDDVVVPVCSPLSGREVEVLGYIARGNSNKEVARHLGISDQTVKNHNTSILRKLAVDDRTEAVVYALRHGWIAMPPC